MPPESIWCVEWHMYLTMNCLVSPLDTCPGICCICYMIHNDFVRNYVNTTEPGPCIFNNYPTKSLRFMAKRFNFLTKNSVISSSLQLLRAMFSDKNIKILCQPAQIFFSACWKNVFIFIFIKFIDTKKVRQLIYFSPLLFIVLGSLSGMAKKSGSGKKKKHPDPQHWLQLWYCAEFCIKPSEEKKNYICWTP